MNMKTLFLAMIVTASATGVGAAQSADELDVINLENLYKNSPSTQPVPIQADPTPTSNQSTLSEAEATLEEKQPQKKSDDVAIDELKDLSRLSPFRDVSIIQKKYLPKTERFQFFGAVGVTTNTPWFNNYGLRLGLSYHFTEALGLELNGMFITSSEREVSKEIRENNKLRPDQFIYTKGYYGLDLVWSPIYGKLSMLDDKIIPFDMYFALGGGISNTNSQEKDVPTFHIGTGQIFAISKSVAFRWDYSFNIFQATPLQDPTVTTAPAKGSYNDLVLTAGVSFFFPEASER